MSKIEPKDGGTTKPWKQKRPVRKVKHEEEGLLVEVFEGKPPVAAHCGSLHRTSPDTGYIRILSGVEEAEFKVPLPVVKNFDCISTILSGDAVYKEKLEHTIRFPEISSEVMETVLRFMFTEFLTSHASASYYGTAAAPRLVFQFEIRPEQAIAVTFAANFLGLTVLLHHASTMVADRFEEVPDVSTLPPDLAWHIATHLSPAGLLRAEEREDFVSLNLDTAPLWESICKKQSWHDLTPPVGLSDRQVSYTEWPLAAVQPTPAASWKSIFVTRTIQQLADSLTIDGADSFVERLSRDGKLVDSHLVRLAVWETLRTRMQPGFLVSYTSAMANLSALFLDELPLHQLLSAADTKAPDPSSRKETESADAAIRALAITSASPGMVLENALSQLPNLQLLSACNSTIAPTLAEGLSRAVATRERLQVLRLSHNELGDAGLFHVLLALRTARMLKLLDVSHNGVQGWVGEDAVAGLRSSSLEEVHFDGNAFTEDNEAAISSMVLSGIPRTCRRLHMEWCNLTDRHVAALCGSLGLDSDLRSLELSSNSIGGGGADAVFRWLETNSSLERLALAQNALSDACAPSLVSALQANSSLLYLSLRGNYNFGDESLQDVISAALLHANALASCGKHVPFALDMAHTNIHYAVRARTLRSVQTFSNVIQLLL